MESLFSHYFNRTTKWYFKVPEIFGHSLLCPLYFGCFKVDFLEAHVSWEFRFTYRKASRECVLSFDARISPRSQFSFEISRFYHRGRSRNSLSEGLQGRFKNAEDLTETWEGAKSGTRNCLGVPKRLLATIRVIFDFFQIFFQTKTHFLP